MSVGQCSFWPGNEKLKYIKQYVSLVFGNLFNKNKKKRRKKNKDKVSHLNGKKIKSNTKLNRGRAGGRLKKYIIIQYRLVNPIYRLFI